MSVDEPKYICILFVNMYSRFTKTKIELTSNNLLNENSRQKLILTRLRI